MAKSSPLQFRVPGVSAADGQALTEAVQTVDPSASVTLDEQTCRVVIGGQGETPDFIAAMEAAGFQVKAVE